MALCTIGVLVGREPSAFTVPRKTSEKNQATRPSGSRCDIDSSAPVQWLPWLPYALNRSLRFELVTTVGGWSGGGRYSRRFGESGPGSDTLFGVASARIASLTCCGVKLGWAARTRAAAPDTCGAANDVPAGGSTAPVVEVDDAEMTSTPGANRLTHGPVLAHCQRASDEPVALTTMAAELLPSRCGESLQASVSSFPAARTTVNPAAMTFMTAVSTAGSVKLKPTLMFTTAGLVVPGSPSSQFRPRMKVSVVPAQSPTLIERTLACLATPYVVPAAIAATAVPCPLQSRSFVPNSEWTIWALPPKST